MAGSSAADSRSHVRSVSFPPRSNASTLGIEVELNRLKSWKSATTSVSNTESICVGLSSLKDLYKCVEEVLQLPIKQENEKLVNEVLDGSLRLLDVCETIRNFLSQVKENSHNLQSGLRRRGGESSMESSADAYFCCRKKMRKEIAKCISALKRRETKIESFPLINIEDQHLSAVIRLLRDVSSITIAIFRYVLSFMSGSVLNSKASKWSLVSKFLHKGQVAYQAQTEETNEVDCVDFAIQALVSNKDADIEKVQTAQKRLNALDVSIEGLENGFECLFKCLIQTRVSLLNNLSQ